MDDELGEEVNLRDLWDIPYSLRDRLEVNLRGSLSDILRINLYVRLERIPRLSLRGSLGISLGDSLLGRLYERNRDG